MRIKNKLSKRELTALLRVINCYGFNPCNKFVLSFEPDFNPRYNSYAIKLLTDNVDLKITLPSKCIWNLESIKKQLGNYIEQR